MTDWCTNHHMSTQSPLNTQSPRPCPPNTQSYIMRHWGSLKLYFVLTGGVECATNIDVTHAV